MTKQYSLYFLITVTEIKLFTVDTRIFTISVVHFTIMDNTERISLFLLKFLVSLSTKKS